MSGTPFTLPRYIPVNSVGRPYPLSTLTFYQAGTTTLTNVYTTAALSVAHANPLTSNSAGLFPAIYLDPASATDYKAVLKNSSGSTLWTEDNIPAEISLTQAAVAAALYPQTAAELAATLTPSNYAYPPGDVRRYGAVLDGVTDDAAAFNAASSQLAQTGGADIVIPSGYTALLGSQWTVARPSYRTFAIHAYGSEIKTSGAISALKITGSYPPHSCTVHGLTVNHRANADAIAGIHLSGTSHVTLVDPVIEGDDNSATYAGILVENSTAADAATGCFWTRIIRPKVRPRSGGDGVYPTCGVLLRGAANATVIRDGSFTSVTGVRMEHHSGQTYVANGVLIDGNSFEGCTTAISFDGAASSTFSGARIVNNRGETLTNFLELTGSTTQPAVPIWMSGNYMISSVDNYVVNVNNLYVNNFDFGVTPSLGLQPFNPDADFSITASAATLTASAATFVAGDVGTAVRIIGAGVAAADLDTTISAYTSATEVTLADNASTTLTTIANAAFRRTKPAMLRSRHGIEIAPTSSENGHALTAWASGAGYGIQCKTNAGIPVQTITWGSGAPTHSAAKGSLYFRTDGGANTCLYVNESGSTTWVGK